MERKDSDSGSRLGVQFRKKVAEAKIVIVEEKRTRILEVWSDCVSRYNFLIGNQLGRKEREELMRNKEQAGRRFWKSMEGVGFSAFCQRLYVFNFCDRDEFTMKNLFNLIARTLSQFSIINTTRGIGYAIQRGRQFSTFGRC